MRESVSYQVLIKKQAKKKLKSLSQDDRHRLVEKIYRLGIDPDDSSLDVKKLTGEPYYRLRVGDWRVIFDRDDEISIISVEKIKPRGDVYK